MYLSVSCLHANAGEVTHTHTGGNKAKLEYYLREAVGDEGETVYPPYQLTGASIAHGPLGTLSDACIDWLGVGLLRGRGHEELFCLLNVHLTLTCGLE